MGVEGPETRDEGREHEAEALSRLEHGAATETRMWLDPEHADAVMQLIRRLRNEAEAPYQCYWRDRALKAERRMNGRDGRNGRDGQEGDGV